MYVSCNLMGGLGNQLFQIFTTIAYAMETNREFIFNNIKNTPGLVYRPTYWNSIFSALQPYLRSNLNTTKWKNYVEPHFHYAEIPHFPNENVVLNGYFQTSKYFEKQKDKIIKLLGLESMRDKFNAYNDAVGMHFRLGDYKQVNEFHPIMPISFYVNHIKEIIEKTGNDKLKIIYYCENNPTDLKIVKNNVNILQTQFPTCKFVSIDHQLTDWEQLLSFSKCKYNIIANSTFSWWGAYLNDNPDKIVCKPMPEAWFGPKLTHYNTRDLTTF